MSEQTKIQWTDHTFNPWIGCTKVSPGCANCYAEKSTPSRTQNVIWGKGKARRRTSATNWKDPLRWNKTVGGRVFCASLADWLDDEVPIEWLADLLKVIHDCPNLTWQLLTKRPENWDNRIRQCFDILSLEPEWLVDWTMRNPPPNIWIGTSVEDQRRADERIPQLLKIPAKVRFLSVEPLLGPVDLHHAMPCGYYCSEEHGHVDHQTLNGIHWVIVGGESGPGARPCNVEWIRDIVLQCKAASVPCFVKQLGSNSRFVVPPGVAGVASMRLNHSKGGDPAEWPEDLRVREFPTVCQEQS